MQLSQGCMWQGIASSIATAVNWLLSFVITDTVAVLSNMFVSMLSGSLPNAIDTGMGGLFMAYGAVCFLGANLSWHSVESTQCAVCCQGSSSCSP